jgi:flagellar biosynthesis GTPase FlhF
MAGVKKLNELNQADLRQEVVDSRMSNENEQHVHKVASDFFDRRKTKVTTALNEWTEKYEKESKDKTAQLKALTDRIETATRDHFELKPQKEKAAELLILELERDKQRTIQEELRSQQEAFMGKLKVLYMLHVARRGRLPRKKKKGKKK